MTTNFTDAEAIARTLLYEGHLLYPYRPSAMKNRYRWTFGIVHCPAWVALHDAGDEAELQVQCLAWVEPSCHIDMSLRFLHVGRPVVEAATQTPGAGGAEHHEAIERQVDAQFDPHRSLAPQELDFAFPPSEHGSEAKCEHRRVSGRITHLTEWLEDGLLKLTVRVRNTTEVAKHELADRSAALLRALVSCQVLLAVRGGQWISLQDPPQRVRRHAENCRTVGLWPVLIGSGSTPQTLLCAQVILSDRPQIAPESPIDWFDATEIDEMLALRLQTLSDQEKRELKTGNAQAGALLDQAERFANEQLMQLHGAQRDQNDRTGEPGRHESTAFQPGDRVRLCPGPGADAMDLILSGMSATVETIEHDLEGQSYVTVTLDDDPGRDLGKLGKPGHRFFLRPEELQKLDDPAVEKS